jgi:hypothetical protein
MITEYLVALSARLALPARRRRRILAEVEDHLLASAAELHADGLSAADAEREAITRFGESSALARIFTAGEAARTAGRLGHVALVLGVLVAFTLAPARGLPNGALTGVLSFTLLQVALVTGALTWWRARAARAVGSLTGAGLDRVRRGALVVGGGGALGTLDVALRGLDGPLPDPAVIAAALTGVGSVACLAAAWRCRRLAVAGAAPADPVMTLAGGIVRLVARRAPRLARWFDLARRPWRAATLTAAAAGLALAGAHGLAEGPPSELTRGLLAGGLLAVIEAMLALAGFAVLGRFLGLRAGSPGRAELPAGD